MEKDTWGDFEVLGEAFKGLSGVPEVGQSSTSFPVMDPPVDTDDINIPDEEKDAKTTSGFKDERTVEEGKSVGQKTIDDLADEILDTDEVDEEEVKEDELIIEEPEDKNIVTPDVEDEPEITPDVDVKTDDVFDLGDAEGEITAFVQEKLYDKLGWEIEEGEEFESVDKLVDYMEKIVEANSTPDFASEDMAKLNDFVKDGGNLADYFKAQGDMDLDNIDLSVEFNQKAVLKETLKERGYSDAQADKKIQRYDETGILEDEAVEAKEFLEKTKRQKADRLLEEQKVQREQVEKQQQKFYSDVASYIDALQDVRGVKVTQADKNKLRDAILKVGPDSKTAYQRKYEENLIKNLTESAFFTVKEDTFIKDIQKQAQSKATKNLKRKLETKKRNKTTGSLEPSGGKSDHSVLNTFASFQKP